MKCHMHNRPRMLKEGIAMDGMAGSVAAAVGGVGMGAEAAAVTATAAGGCMGEDGEGSTFCVRPARRLTVDDVIKHELYDFHVRCFRGKAELNS